MMEHKRYVPYCVCSNGSNTVIPHRWTAKNARNFYTFASSENHRSTPIQTMPAATNIAFQAETVIPMLSTREQQSLLCVGVTQEGMQARTGR